MDKTNIKENEVHVRFFGALEIENQRGCIVETLSSPSHSNVWGMLKYLLANAGRAVSQSELSKQALGAEEEESGNAIRSRLNRVRKLLDPLQLGGVNGLIIYYFEQYIFNPEYTIYTDADRFNLLMRQVRKLPPEDPQGLAVCAEALELFRGQFLEHTRDAEWLRTYQEAYKKEFEALAKSTLERLRIFDDDKAIDLLINRAPQILPEAEELHKAIVAYLVEKKMTIEVIKYVACLTRDGQPEWTKALI